MIEPCGTPVTPTYSKNNGLATVVPLARVLWKACRDMATDDIWSAGHYKLNPAWLWTNDKTLWNDRHTCSENNGLPLKFY